MIDQSRDLSNMAHAGDAEMTQVKSLSKKLAVGLGIVAAVFLLFLLEENLRGKIALHAYVRQLRARGEKLTLAELELPKGLPETDAASARVLEAARTLQALRQRCPIALPFVPKLWWTAPGQVIVKTRQEELRAGMVKFTPPTGVILLPDEQVREANYRRATWSDLADQLALAGEALAELRAALANHSGGLAIDYAHDPTRNWPAHVVMAGVVDWLGAAAIQDLRANHLREALENVAAILAYAEFLKPAALPAWQDARLDAAEVGLDVTWHILHAPQLSDADLLRLQRVWSFDAVIGDLLKALEVDRARQLRRYDEVRYSGREWCKIWIPLVGVHEPNPPDEYDSAWFLRDVRETAWLALWWAAWMDCDKLQYLKQAQWTVDLARRAAARKTIAEFSQSHDELPAAQSNSDYRRFVLARQLAPDTSPLYKGMVFETRREMTRTAIALERYHRRTRQYPAGLQELQPEFLAVLPHDWMDGRPLRYRLNRAGAYTLYSVGQDCRDDDGDPSATDPSRLALIWDGRDAVWPQPANLP